MDQKAHLMGKKSYTDLVILTGYDDRKTSFIGRRTRWILKFRSGDIQDVSSWLGEGKLDRDQLLNCLKHISKCFESPLPGAKFDASDYII
ncbi:hypothetical protein JTE90_027170 [Oedothorax gibbosus]|uniref:Uncharacterized protein n=1 Tax=Oedothorax gibbosus TaxID=931172 RepID=A0AAV6TZR7_9ARAC|nr:hypothetical protein JTE90_027170 [Oedothorax gibbosus]